MEQEPTPILELIGLILFLGSITFLIGALFQAYILWKNKKSILISLVVIVLTRCMTVISSYFIWAFWHLPIDIMFLFLYLPAVLPELILSPLVLKIFGNQIFKMKKPVHNNVYNS
jgi:ABC-type sulfate transport system permease component